ncbi:alpha/beta hydrolase [Clostridium sp. DL1XJH146]
MRYFLVIIMILLVIVVYYFVNYYFKESVKMKVVDYSKLYNKYSSEGLFNKDYYEGLKKEKIEILSEDGFRIKGIYIEGQSEDKRTIIFVHGITANLSTSIKFIEMFHSKGWNVLLYDQRRHGESEGNYSTYGFYEKFDLNKWVQWIIEKNGQDSLLGLHGVSMGAATVLQYNSINKYVDFIISDCGFSDLDEQFRISMKKALSVLLLPVYTFAKIRILRKAKFSVDKVKPIEDIKTSDIPILFIHGKEDKYVPTYMSEKMYQAKKNNKAIYLVDGAKHAVAFDVDKERYEKEIFRFIYHYFPEIKK